MNGLKRLLAMALAMLLLILPAAMAEENAATAHTLTISNIAVNAAGVDLLDLEGLSVEMTAADTGDAVEFVLRLLGGEDVAAEGYALFDGRELLLGADGLSSAYALPLEKMMGDDIAPALQLFAELLSEDTLVGLIEGVSGAVIGMYDDIFATRTELGVREMDMGGATMEMQGLSYTQTEEATRAYFEAYFDALYQIPIFAMAMEGSGAAPDAYNAEKGASYDDDIEQAFEMVGDTTVTYWYAGEPSMPDALRIEMSNSGDMSYTYAMDAVLQEDGTYAVKLSYTAEYQGESLSIAGEGVFSAGWVVPPMLYKSSSEDIVADMLAMYGDLGVCDMTFTMEASEEEFAEGAFFYYPQGYNAQSADRSALGFNMNMSDEDGETTFIAIDGYYSPADGVNYLYNEFYGLMQVSAAGQTQTAEVTVQTQHADGHEYYGAEISSANPYSGAQKAYFTYEGDYTENALGSEDNAGVLTLGATVGYEGSAVNYAVTADVSMTHAAVDPASLPAPTGGTVDLLMLDEKGYEQLATEGGLLAMRLAGTLGQNVPGLTRLLSGIGIF